MSNYLTLADLAERWGVRYGTVVVWKQRGKLPEPDISARSPLWSIETIEDHERANGTDRD